MQVFLNYFKEYFRGFVKAEYREVFLCEGDPGSSRRRERSVVWVRGIETYVPIFIKDKRDLVKWNVFLGVGYSSSLEITLDNVMYDRISFDFDFEEDPSKAVNQSLDFARSVESEYDSTPLVFLSGFKGAHVVVPLSRGINWETYRLVWKHLIDRHVSLNSKHMLDMNMLQWNRVDRVPLTYNVKEGKVRYCSIIYPREFSWEDFSWRELKPLDPSRVSIVKVVTPPIVKPILLKPKYLHNWVWKIVERGLDDGRKRFMLMVLIPRLVHSNYSDEEVLQVCRLFIESSCRNYGKCDKIHESWLKSVIRSAKIKEFKGFGLLKLKEKDPELYSIISRTLQSPRTQLM
ncbi:MAG: DNA primase noncatalytic subunit PriX [Candidatus Parvarchaeota archaeon]|nr:DNA primase noncatalytic subunit PriX [Candidatus Haiyanarchaeum thermophilum]